MSALQFDAAGLFEATGVLERDQFEALQPRLEEARRSLLTPDEEGMAQDRGFVELPGAILNCDCSLGFENLLERIQTTADTLRERVRSVVLVGVGGSSLGLRAIMDSCCGPYWNERAESPRFYFAGESLDNDATSWLLKLLRESGEPFAIVVVSKSGGTLEPAVAFRQLFNVLREIRQPSWPPLSQLVVPITGSGSRLGRIADDLECEARFEVPERVGGRFSLLSSVGLVPAALLGVDIKGLLEGAEAMNGILRESPLEDNPVLVFAGVGFLSETLAGLTIRVLASWDAGLVSSGAWYEQLLAESLGKQQLGSTPLVTFNTRDLHSRGQQHQQGRRDKLVINVAVDSPQTEALTVGPAAWSHDGLDSLIDRTLPELLLAAREGTNEALHAEGYPTATLQLPGRGVFWMGQFYQMMMLATVIEGRLLGVNPYGQPGVEAYKKNMARLLGLE